MGSFNLGRRGEGQSKALLPSSLMFLSAPSSFFERRTFLPLLALLSSFISIAVLFLLVSLVAISLLPFSLYLFLFPLPSNSARAAELSSAPFTFPLVKSKIPRFQAVNGAGMSWLAGEGAKQCEACGHARKDGGDSCYAEEPKDWLLKQL